MLNNINNYGSILNTSLNSASSSAQSSEVDNIIENYKAQDIDKLPENSKSQNSLYLSSRAQKINAISSEFFNGAELNFNDVETLKERAYQLGLISQNEYAKLTNSTSKTENQVNEIENTTISLTGFLDDLLKRLQSDENNESHDSESSDEQQSEALNALIKALEGAKEIITHVEEAKQKDDFKDKLANTLSLLKDTIDAPTFEKIPLNDKVGLSKVYQALEIVEQLTPQRLTNEKLNKYLDLSFS